MNLTGNVSMEWLSSQNMTRGLMQIGVPVDLKNLSKGLIWKMLQNLTDEDYDIIEEYHKMKTNEQKKIS